MSRKPFIVQIAPLGEWADACLRERYEVLPLWRESEPLACLAARGAGARVAVTSVRYGCSAQMMALMPELEAICSWGVGYETIDLGAARARGIQVSYTPDVLDGCVADLAWGLLIATARRIAEGDRYVRGGQWRTIGAFPLSTRVGGKRLGILGMGRIGEAIARRGQGFDMQVAYHNRGPRAGSPYRFEPSLAALADWADFLVVACVGGPATHHLVSAQIIEALGPQGILVNIARGTVIDQDAMVAALAAGRLGGAGLDVLEREPAVPDALKALDSVVLMPHVGSATHETRRDMAQLVIDNAASYLQGRGLITPIRD
ncbi:2-hydroxyacid dehydrogenase [Cupriavidus basilensis]|uniref:2-hydroxyacid dehydrogenase n=1 Tax=Cupriavidus basilensis TaxID=68895 RepID=UPI000750B46C|nr:2-hydroxyacid dehydrogenase [Cupriavidus basilensis]